MSVFSSSRHEEDHRSQTAPQSTPQTVVAEGVRVEGDFKGQGDIVIDGEVKGNISTDGMLSVGQNANIEADMNAERAVISGKVFGNVTVRSHLEIKATASVRGDVTSGTVTIESGASLRGMVSIGAQDGAEKTDVTSGVSEAGSGDGHETGE
ncbi:MAG: polymer-forming cytoskeletal protein [bacterium]|nr:polymer-forming cytoskeletal protein [bacterium]